MRKIHLPPETCNKIEREGVLDGKVLLALSEEDLVKHVGLTTLQALCVRMKLDELA